VEEEAKSKKKRIRKKKRRRRIKREGWEKRGRGGGEFRGNAELEGEAEFFLNLFADPMDRVIFVSGLLFIQYKCRPFIPGRVPTRYKCEDSTFVPGRATTRYKCETFIPGGEEEDSTRPCEGTSVRGGGSNRYKWGHFY
jgi:hypothetical protein